MIGPVRKAIVHLPVRLKGNLKYNSGNLLKSAGGPEQGSRCCFADQTLLARVKQTRHECWLTQTCAIMIQMLEKYPLSTHWQSQFLWKERIATQRTMSLEYICSHCCMLSLRGYLNSIICPFLENSWNKHWVLQIFHEIYHKHKTHGISYKIQPYTVHVNKTIIDGPIPLTSVLSVTPKISVELKMNSFSPLSVRQGPYTILKDLWLLPAWMTGKKRYKN